MNKLGFGFMRMPLTDPDDQRAIDLPQVERMADAFFQAGFTYCDTAWMYHKFMSEPTVGKAVVARYPRDSFTIASKMPVFMIHSREEGVQTFAAQKEKLGVDYFDYYLMHNMDHENYELAKKYDMLNFLREKKASGEIRRLGFSCHDTAEFLDKVLTECPYFEFVQLQINYLDWEDEEIQSRKCYEVCVKHGKPVIVMEPVKGGTLANVPDPVKKLLQSVHPDWSPASWALRFAASLPGVEIVLSGMSNMDQLTENIGFMKDMEPLTSEEVKNDIKDIQEVMAPDAPLVIVVHEGVFTTTGHYFVVTGCDGDYLTINDPNSSVNSEKKWNYYDFNDQIENIWVIRKAYSGDEPNDTDYHFRNNARLEEHYQKHGVDMGFYTPQDYEDAAEKVIKDKKLLLYFLLEKNSNRYHMVFY